MKNLKNLGKALNEAEQKLINGGILGVRSCVRSFCVDGSVHTGTLYDSKGIYIGCCTVPITIDDYPGL